MALFPREHKMTRPHGHITESILSRPPGCPIAGIWLGRQGTRSAGQLALAGNQEDVSEQVLDEDLVSRGSDSSR